MACLRRPGRGQTILEYSLMVAVTIAALLIVQVFVKRGYQGKLKESSERIGEQFSRSGSSSIQQSHLSGTQTVTEETATNDTMADFLPPGAPRRLAGDEGVFSGGMYSANARTGGEQVANVTSALDSGGRESYGMDEYNRPFTDFQW